jgi:hypothetical protein
MSASACVVCVFISSEFRRLLIDSPTQFVDIDNGSDIIQINNRMSVFLCSEQMFRNFAICFTQYDSSQLKLLPLDCIACLDVSG